MAYSDMAVRFFTTPKPLGDAMEPDSSKHNSQGHTVVRPNVSTEHPSSEGVEIHTPKQQGLTFANQDSLPKLPIPDLEDTCRRHLDALAALQNAREHEDSKAAVREFLKTDGPALQERLKTYATSKTSFIEQFWYDSYLNFDNRELPIPAHQTMRFLSLNFLVQRLS